MNCLKTFITMAFLSEFLGAVLVNFIVLITRITPRL
jgi:hypothetical protein